jgi:hypothetical protein
MNMKRIKKFNENNLDLDYDYIYNCFAELIDDNKASIRNFQNDHQRYITIDLKMKPFSSVKVGTSPRLNRTPVGPTEKIKDSLIFDYIDGVKYNYDLLKEVEVGLTRLSEEYPDYITNFEIFDNVNSIHINIFNSWRTYIKE